MAGWGKRPGEGLSPFGRDVVRRLGELGLCLDLTHINRAGFFDALAYATGLPSVFVRKEVKGHGLGRRIEGGDVAARRVALVEDMVTTGGSSLSAVEALRGVGLGYLLLFRRQLEPEGAAIYVEVTILRHQRCVKEVHGRTADKAGDKDIVRRVVQFLRGVDLHHEPVL